MKTVATLAFLSIFISPAFAAVPSTEYVEGAVTHVKEYTDSEISKNKLTAGSNITITNNKVSVANGTQTTAGVVKYGTIPTTSTGTGEALIWVE